MSSDFNAFEELLTAPEGGHLQFEHATTCNKHATTCNQERVKI